MPAAAAAVSRFHGSRTRASLEPTRPIGSSVLHPTAITKQQRTQSDRGVRASLTSFEGNAFRSGVDALDVNVELVRARFQAFVKQRAVEAVPAFPVRKGCRESVLGSGVFTK
jgi:hypothetical protein